MAYARCGKDSDVYVFGSKEYLECYVAIKHNITPFLTKSRNEMLDYLIDLRDNKNIKVPQHAIDRLINEAGYTYGDFYKPHK